MDYPSQLSRFLQHRVTLDLYGRSTVWGKLVYVADDHVRLVDTVIVGDLEGHGWYEQSQYADEDGSGVRNPETIVRITSVVQVTCLDELDAESLPSSVSIPSESSFAEEGEIRDTSDGMILSLRELAEGLRNGDESVSAGRQRSDIDAMTVPLSTGDEVRTMEDRLMIEIGVQLIPLAASDDDGGLVKRVTAVRKELAVNIGVVIPKVRIRDSLSLDESGYRILMDGDEIARGELMLNRSLAICCDKPSTLLDGVETVEPAFGLKAKWIAKSDEARATAVGWTVCSPSTVLITHFAEAVRSRLHELICHQDVIDRISELREVHPDAIDALIPDRVTIPVLHRLLQDLLEEGVRIKRLMRIMESVAYHVDVSCDRFRLLRCVRRDIGRSICRDFVDEGGTLRGLCLEESSEHELESLPRDPIVWAQNPVLRNLVDQVEEDPETRLVVVGNPEIRRLLFDTILRLGTKVNVIAREEIPTDVSIGLLEIDVANEVSVHRAVLPR